MHKLSLTALFLFFLPLLVHAQSLPVIDFFTVDNDALDYAHVEAGFESANFSWQASGLRPGDSMAMHAWVGGTWALIGEGFEPAKTDTLVIAHPLSFELPRYRLSVVDSAEQIVAESILELHYATPANLPSVNFFLPRESSLPPEAILNDEGVAVHWQVYSRWHRSNIYFYQVFSDGRVIDIADNNPNEWRRAYTEGILYPEYPGDNQDVVLRLSVVNIDTGETLAQRDTIVPIIRSDAPPAEVRSFTVSPTTGQRGGRTTLSWDVTNATRVYITQTVTGVSGCKFTLPPDEVYRDLPPSGSLEVQIPEYAPGPIRFQIVPDRYIVGAFSCEPGNVLEEIYLELENYSHPNPLIRSMGVNPRYTAAAGSTINLNWDIVEGQSVIIEYGTSYLREATQRFENLPITGTLEITLPDTVEVRLDDYVYIEFYLVREGVAEPEYLWAYTLGIDPDDDLACNSYIVTDPVYTTVFAPNQTLNLSWNGCGVENLMLRTQLEDLDNNYAILTTQDEALVAEGSQTVTLPNQGGVLRFIMYRLIDGQEVEIQRTSILIEN